MKIKALLYKNCLALVGLFFLITFLPARAGAPDPTPRPVDIPPRGDKFILEPHHSLYLFFKSTYFPYFKVAKGVIPRVNTIKGKAFYEYVEFYNQFTYTFEDGFKYNFSWRELAGLVALDNFYNNHGSYDYEEEWKVGRDWGIDVVPIFKGSALSNELPSLNNGYELDDFIFARQGRILDRICQYETQEITHLGQTQKVIHHYPLPASELVALALDKEGAEELANYLYRHAHRKMYIQGGLIDKGEAVRRTHWRRKG
ncbi:MAG: hypothetical protein MI749_03960, partial [Desulfovibrionales bacterium]|nr:hypothetical protein [Desulfovibrionales bacterium]